MLISELIARLNAAKKLHGDILVLALDKDGDPNSSIKISFDHDCLVVQGDDEAWEG